MVAVLAVECFCFGKIQFLAASMFDVAAVVKTGL